MESLSAKKISRLKSVVIKAGKLLLIEFKKGNNHAQFKSRHEIVTPADLLAEKLILQKLNELTPDFQIISEEKGDNKKKSDYCWLLDPLDGTTNFYMGNPLFAVQIALLFKNEPVLSMIYAPVMNNLYFAQKGKGAFLNNKRLKVSSRTLNQALLTYCHGYKNSHIQTALKIYQHFKLKNFDIRQLGSAGLEFAFVAQGKTECYITPGVNPWDVAPGALLVQEAGGKVSDFAGKDWSLASNNVFASNGIIDRPLLKFLITL